MLDIKFSKFIEETLKKRKKAYLITRRNGWEDTIIFETFSKKQAILRADLEAKNNKANLSRDDIVLTTYRNLGEVYCVSEKYIKEKTLDRTINSKKFKNLKR